MDDDGANVMASATEPRMAFTPTCQDGGCVQSRESQGMRASSLWGLWRHTQGSATNWGPLARRVLPARTRRRITFKRNSRTGNIVDEGVLQPDVNGSADVRVTAGARRRYGAGSAPRYVNDSRNPPLRHAARLMLRRAFAGCRQHWHESRTRFAASDEGRRITPWPPAEPPTRVAK